MTLAYGSWTVLRPDKERSSGAKYSWCKCVCGAERSVRDSALRLGHSKSCGSCGRATSKVSKFESLLGHCFGKWSVLGPLDSSSDKRVWCRCECGSERWVIARTIVSGESTSCGKCNSAGRFAIRHGHSRGKLASSTYVTWRAMKSRCQDPNNIGFSSYGGRGISVCAEWSESFDAFLADMGERPIGKTLDRKDNSKNYTPDNCKWATPTEQNSNTSRNRLIEFKGVKLCLSDWAKRVGLGKTTLKRRLDKSWSIERALTTPVKRKKAKP